MKEVSIHRQIGLFLLCSLAITFLLAACDGDSITDGGDGGGGCVGTNCIGTGPTPRPGEARLSVSIVPDDGQNTLTFTPPSGNAATLFNVYWSLSPEVTEANWTKIEGVANPFLHDVTQDGLSNGTPIFYIATIASGSDESAASTVVGGMPGKWTPLTPSGSLPPARDSHTAVYNSTTDRMIVFGGKDQNGTFQDLRVLSGAKGNPTWTTPTTTNLPPESRASHTAIYNEQTNRMVVFGGSLDTAGNNLRNDLWLLSHADASENIPAWQPVTFSQLLPSPRWGHAAVYDQEEDLMIVFGGVRTGVAIFNDVWVLERATEQFTSTWRQISMPATGGPSARCCVAVGYDSTNRRMIIFGGSGFGQGGPVQLGDLWTLTFDATFQTATWQELTPSGGTAPSARCCAASFWDGSKFLLFGGGDFNSSSDDKIYAFVLQDDTFATADGPSGGPPARTFPTAVPAGHFLLFGGTESLTPLRDLWRLE